MKIRTGFISNSSSTSFIIAINPSQRCEHCGRSDPSIIDLLERGSAYYVDENRVRKDPEEIKEYVEQLKYENKEIQRDLDELLKKNDNDIAIPAEDSYRYSSRAYTVKEVKKWRTDEINENQLLIDGIEKALNDGKEVYEIGVSYHDDTIRQLIKEQVKNKTIEIINEVD